MKKPPPPLTPLDYARIHQVIRAVLDGTGSPTNVSCHFFSMAGAMMMGRAHRKRGNPVTGSAALCIGGEPLQGIVLSSREGRETAPNRDNYHCWVEYDGFVIDFMAPIFREFMQRINYPHHIPRKMLQAPIASGFDSPKQLRKSGEFSYRVDPALTVDFIRSFGTVAEEDDLLAICLAWYKPFPAKIAPTFLIRSNSGPDIELRLRPSEIDGAW
jgi:hypothetical protein